MLPEHLLQYLNEQVPCRELQVLQLASLLDPAHPSPHTIVVHGTTATGKTLAINATLPALEALFTVIKVRECITARHLLERTVLGVKSAIEARTGQEYNEIDGRCENAAALAVALERLLGKEEVKNDTFVIVFDGIDKLRDGHSQPTLLPGLVRLGEMIPNLTVVLVMTSPLPRSLHRPALPHVHFPPYDRTSALKIVSMSPMDIYPLEQVETMDQQERLKVEEDSVWLWNKYAGVVWDSLGRSLARDIVSYKALCQKLWVPFVSHVRNGSYGPRDFAKLVVRTRDVFRDESVLSDNLTISQPGGDAKDGQDMKKRTKASHDLSYYTKHLLLAAYLASYNPSRSDQIMFTRLYDRKKKRIAARKKSGVSKDGTATAATPKHRRISRLLLGPQPFPLERLLAIFHAILPEKTPAGNADVLCQIATLVGLRMLVKASAGIGSDGAGGALDGSAKWRINLGWEYIQQLGRRVGIDMADFVVE